MNNYSFSNNYNNFVYTPSFSKSDGNVVVQNNVAVNSLPGQISEIKKNNNKKKLAFEKVLTTLAWIGGVSLSLFGVYKFVEYKNPGFFKQNFLFWKRNNIEEKSFQERNFLQRFNDLYKECRVEEPKNIEIEERKFVERAFKNKEISEKEKIKFEEKIKMRRKIRDFNSTYDANIPLTPYGGVAEIAHAYSNIKDKNAKIKFREILAYKIEKLETKLDLLKKRKSSNKEKDIEFSAKANRTNDLIESLKEIKKGHIDYKCFYVDYKPQYIENEIIEQNGSYNIKLKNEFGQQYPINLSKETFNNMFKNNKMISQTISDCYLVGTLNSIINNPKHRCRFYQMFSEDEKNITFTFNDGFKVKFLKDEDGKPELLNNQHDSLDGGIGYKMFEEAYALHRLYIRAQKGYKNVKQDKDIEIDIKNYALSDNKLEGEFNEIIKQCAKYIEGSDKSYKSVLEGGTINEVANTLFFDVLTNAYCLNGYHDYAINFSNKKMKSDDEISQILSNMMKNGNSIVVGRDEFKVNNIEEKYEYNGINLYNSHFSVVRYYNNKTKEVHIFESNNPQKILILPLSEFNQQYSLLYGF